MDRIRHPFRHWNRGRHLILVPHKKTESQTRKQIFERSENVENIFRVENTDTLKNKHILLVDDVITTGSTMNACAEAMKAISGIRISILGIAVA